ncbi:MAG: ATP-binding protein [Bacteroidetes bacterium]|nr:ATP-binding protein [Bacteroidota bacterium]
MLKHFGKNEHVFRFEDESDGTKRLLELLPIFYLIQTGFTILIDEIERSLHPKLIKG